MVSLLRVYIIRGAIWPQLFYGMPAGISSSRPIRSASFTWHKD